MALPDDDCRTLLGELVQLWDHKLPPSDRFSEMTALDIIEALAALNPVVRRARELTAAQEERVGFV
jgi:hypothetical protein